MKRHSVALGAFIAFLCCLNWAAPANAQGLLWKLPKEDGTWVRYEGTYKQVKRRPDSPEGDLIVGPWIQHLTIKSVGTETAEFEGKPTPCRWIEFKLVTGHESEAGVDPGASGLRIYKVLVPESEVQGKLMDERNIPQVYIPIVKGYSKSGDSAPTAIEQNVLQVYPLISLLRHYKKFEAQASQPEEIDTALGRIAATPYKGKYEMESPDNRITNEATIWLSDDVPFGAAKWNVRTRQEVKDTTAPRTDFRDEGERVEEMSVHEVGTGARSELPLP